MSLIQIPFLESKARSPSAVEVERSVVRSMPTNLNVAGVRRIFGFGQILGFSLNFMNSWEVVAISFGAAVYNGGPASLSWGTILVVIGSLTQALSMAELGSILPIAGAQYHWTYLLAPEKHKRFVTWVQGWITWFAWVSALAGSTSAMSSMIQSLVAFNDPQYTAPRWQIAVLMILLLVVCGLLNSFIFQVIPWLEAIAGVLHIILWPIFLGILLMNGERQSAYDVFLTSSSTSGWKRHPFVAYNIGMLVPAWGFIGFDGAVHMSEEVRKAKNAVPRSMILTILTNGALAFAMSLALTFTETAQGISNPDYPIISTLYSATGSKMAVNALVSMLLILTFAVVAASLASTSRITWAWSRDGALPAWFAHISPKFRVPIRAIWLPILIVGLLSLMNIGSTTTTAFSAFTALSSLGLYSSYIVTFCCLLKARGSGYLGVHGQVQYGEWQLWPKARTPVNCVALAWTIWLTIWLPFPTTIPATRSDMNYALPVYMFVLSLALVSWRLWARSRWAGLNQSPIEAMKNEN